MVSASTVKRRSVQRLAGRKRPSYYESDAEDVVDSEADHDDGSGEERGPKRRSARQNAVRERNTYEEPESVDELLEEQEDLYSQGLSQPNRQRKPRPTKRTTRSSVRPQRRPQRSKAQEKKKQPRRRDIGAPLKKREGPELKKTGFNGPSDGRIPAWTSLPLEILRDVFMYASQPMHEQTVTAQENVTWLMRAARTCRAFAIPALEAYYQSPVLHNTAQPHYLLELLKIPKDKTYLNYAVKIKSLDIDVVRIAYQATGKPAYNLSDLVRVLPLLQHLEVMHPKDWPPYRYPGRIRWGYPIDLFSTLNDTGTQLKSWRWSLPLIPVVMLDDLWGSMSQVHKSHAFEHLERLVLCGFTLEDVHATVTSHEENVTPSLGLSAAVSVLPSLRDITFHSCELVAETFLQRLPQTLHRLELSNCLEVTSGMVQTYLELMGTHLRELELNHNPALKLSFLTNLQNNCPRLEVLKMNLTYYSERDNSNDAWAMYEELLGADETPSWPSTLRHLELVHLQNWTSEAAQNLFRSLTDAAEQLPHLRHLIIQAHINIPWRDRAGFRDHWIDRLQHIFLRRMKDPNPEFGSLKQMRLWKEVMSAKRRGERYYVAEDASHQLNNTDDAEATRYKFARVMVSPPGGPEPQSSSARPRRSTRVAEIQSSADESFSEPGSEDEAMVQESDGAFVQGLCEVVDIRIDNQRPREKQWTEGEFLDSEVSGDEDWQEGMELDDEEVYGR